MQTSEIKISDEELETQNASMWSSCGRGRAAVPPVRQTYTWQKKRAIDMWAGCLFCAVGCCNLWFTYTWRQFTHVKHTALCVTHTSAHTPTHLVHKITVSKNHLAYKTRGWFNGSTCGKDAGRSPLSFPQEGRTHVFKGKPVSKGSVWSHGHTDADITTVLGAFYAFIRPTPLRLLKWTWRQTPKPLLSKLVQATRSSESHNFSTAPSTRPSFILIQWCRDEKPHSWFWMTFPDHKITIAIVEKWTAALRVHCLPPAR